MGYHEKAKFKNYWDWGRLRETNQRNEKSIQWNNIRKFPKYEEWNGKPSIRSLEDSKYTKLQQTHTKAHYNENAKYRIKIEF